MKSFHHFVWEFLAIRRLGKHFFEAGYLVDWHELPERLSDNFFGSIAIQPRGATAPANDRAIHIDGQEGLVCGFQHRGKQVLWAQLFQISLGLSFERRGRSAGSQAAERRELDLTAKANLARSPCVLQQR